MGTKMTAGSGKQKNKANRESVREQDEDGSIVSESQLPMDSYVDDGFGSGGTSQGATNKMTIMFGGKTPKEQLDGSNKVRTTKYTLLSWAPLSLFNQFRRAANVYFLFITILTIMPFSPKKPASMIGTFTLVLVFTMLKEAYEDY